MYTPPIDPIDGITIAVTNRFEPAIQTLLGQVPQSAHLALFQFLDWTSVTHVILAVDTQTQQPIGIATLAARGRGQAPHGKPWIRRQAKFELRGVYVLPTYRGRGIGHQLVLAAWQLSRKDGSMSPIKAQAITPQGKKAVLAVAQELRAAQPDPTPSRGTKQRGRHRNRQESPAAAPESTAPFFDLTDDSGWYPDGL